MAPAYWAVLACLAVTVVEAALAGSGSTTSPAKAGIYRYLAGAAAFCPLLALLGAKRPQDRAWGWIVLSLWVVLALPALEAWLFQLGRQFELHPARAWFLLILIVTGAVNHLATRYALSAGLVSAGQVLLMKEFLPAGLAGPASPRTALALFAAAILVAWFVPRRRERSIDRVWLDFRDAFGLVWGLRVQERLNSLATTQSWPVRLTWQGFERLPPGEDQDQATLRPDETSASGEREAGDVLRKALWRFVSPSWIDARSENDQR